MRTVYALAWVVVVAVAIAGCNGAPLPLDTAQVDGGAAAVAQASPVAPGDAGVLAPVACRVELEAPFSADVTARCTVSPDGLAITARWVSGDLAWQVAASVDGPTVTWEWRPCGSPWVSATESGIAFRAACNEMDVRGEVVLLK